MSSGEEGPLCIDTEPRNSDKGGRKGKGGAKKDGLEVPRRIPPKAGDIVWAKVSGFTYWPAKVFDAETDTSVVPFWLKMPPKMNYLLVRFFGTYDMQWVSPSAIETYDRGLSKKFQSKSRSKLFQKAVKEVFGYTKDSVVPEGLTIPPPYPVDPPEAKGKAKKKKQGLLSPPLTNPTPSEPLEVENDKPAPNSGSDGSTAQNAGSGAPPPNNDSDAPPRKNGSGAPPPNNGSSPEIGPAVPNTSSNKTKGSSRRKSSTPRRLSSSSSESQAKRPRLDSAESSPEVRAFTSAPLPLASVPAKATPEPGADDMVPIL